jgi:hypothetical protein
VFVLQFGGNKNGNKSSQYNKKGLNLVGQVLDFFGAGNGIRKLPFKTTFNTNIS